LCIIIAGLRCRKKRSKTLGGINVNLLTLIFK
jgi:hypothetical protein